MSRVVVVGGGRDYGDWRALFDVLDDEHARDPIGLLVEGGADGADNIGGDWADRRGVDHDRCFANWNGRGKAGGPARNARMIAPRAAPSLVVVAPGGAGTANLISQVQRANLAIRRVR